MVKYDRFLQEVKSLDFIRNQEMADAAVKAVLGMLASSMNENHARRFTNNLPDPLTYERLVGHQAKPIAPSLGQVIGEISTIFRIDYDQAHRLIDTVFRTTKQAVGENVLTEVESDLPSDVVNEIERM